MNSYQRLSLINEIAIKLQQERRTREINILLGPYDLKSDLQSQVASKRVYVQELLAKEPISKILKIARDLEMDLSVYKVRQSKDTTAPTVWLEGEAKLFISHLAKDKEKAARVQHYLLRNGMSGFVAHEDIEPAKDWQEAIEEALRTMDALVALITPGFFSSIWTNQEIGYALGAEKKIIAVRVGEDPKGFLGRYQAVNGKGRVPKDIVSDIVSLVRQ